MFTALIIANLISKNPKKSKKIYIQDPRSKKKFDETSSKKILNARKKDLIYKKYKKKEIQDYNNTQIIINKFFYSDIANTLSKFIYAKCYNCKINTLKYKILFKQKYCIECYYKYFPI